MSSFEPEVSSVSSWKSASHLTWRWIFRIWGFIFMIFALISAANATVSFTFLNHSARVFLFLFLFFPGRRLRNIYVTPPYIHDEPGCFFCFFLEIGFKFDSKVDFLSLGFPFLNFALTSATNAMVSFIF